MTSQIVIINGNRSFAITESNLTLDEFKTYVGEEKIFEISQKLSAVALVSGSGRFDSQKIKNHITRYLAKTDMDEIKSVLEIKNTLNDCIVKSTRKSDPSKYVKSTFPKFENMIIGISKNLNKYEFIEYLKMNSLNENINVLDNNNLLNNSINKLRNTLFDINDKYDSNELKFYLKRNYYNYLVKLSTNLVLVGYDEEYENPTYIKYAILFNNDGKLEIYDEYFLNNCNSTMIFTIAQDEDINLNLTGFNDKSYYDIQKIVFNFFDEIVENVSDEFINSLNNKLEEDIFNIKLNNLAEIIDYIEFLPDEEILNFLEILIQLTSIKKKFSKQPHTVGGKTVKTVLRKYDGVKFIE